VYIKTIYRRGLLDLEVEVRVIDVVGAVCDEHVCSGVRYTPTLLDLVWVA
jgi:hypothetical protein